MNGRLCWLKLLKISAQSFHFFIGQSSFYRATNSPNICRYPITKLTFFTIVTLQVLDALSLFYCYIVRCTWNVLKMSFSLNACVFLDDFLAASYYIVSSVQWFKICSLNVQRFSLQWVCSEHTKNTDNFLFRDAWWKSLNQQEFQGVIAFVQKYWK